VLTDALIGDIPFRGQNRKTFAVFQAFWAEMGELGVESPFQGRPIFLINLLFTLLRARTCALGDPRALGPARPLITTLSKASNSAATAPVHCHPAASGAWSAMAHPRSASAQTSKTGHSVPGLDLVGGSGQLAQQPGRRASPLDSLRA
jgi:hypothetical protein